MIFNHLHCHTQYSLLDGAASIAEMYKKAENDGMKAIAITDHGNMFGVFDFVAQAGKHNGVKPIVGCEFYVVADRHKRAFTGGEKDRRYHQLFLAKNSEGYRNLVKMCSLGFIEGLYGKYPRIDKDLILKHHKGLIATTCCLGALVPQTILSKGEAAARKEFEWWLDLFGEDYYIELQRHQLRDQETVNEVLLRFAKDYNVTIIASNDSHYVDRQDANAHDILLCINTGEKQATPKMDDFTDDGASTKGKRFAFANDEFYFKNTAEMTALFKDLPQAIDNTNEIVDKIEPLKLKRDILLPHFQIPEGFIDQDDYLRYLSYKGAYERYGEILTTEIEERINFELFTVKTMGFAGYFLIVADFIKAGRDLGVFVGPGRGCLTGDTKVVIHDGTTKDLDQIAIGDKVYTQNGSVQVVKQLFKYDIDEILLRIKTHYGDHAGVTLTKDHKVLAEKQTENPNGNNLQWLPASELSVGDWVFVPKPQADTSETFNFDGQVFANITNNTQNAATYNIVDQENWYEMFGLFLARGFAHEGGKQLVHFVFNEKYTDKLTWFKKHLNDNKIDFAEHISNNSTQLQVRNKGFFDWFVSLVYGQSPRKHQKRLPNFILNAPEPLLLHFLRAYTRAKAQETRYKLRFERLSRTFADQLRFAFWRVGIPSELEDVRLDLAYQIPDDNKTPYFIAVPKDESIWHTSSEGNYAFHQVEGGMMLKIKGISSVEGVNQVYDFEVNEYHNYLTSSFLVHNSAAGSAVAYCIGITNIDPMKYNLLFERFLNPDRKSMPDIDTDFDDEGRQKVIDYVVSKYGKQQVAHIVTYGTMAAKMSIKDVARVLDLPLADANALAKLVPERPGIKLKRIITAPLSGEGGLSDKESLNSEEMENAKQLREIHGGDDIKAKVLREALILEGSVRGTGIHAAGIIIAPSDLSEIIPVAAVKDVNLYITQFEGNVIEDAGVIKMDFLGLKTLTIMRDALLMIEENHGIKINIDTIPLDDAKTYELYQRGDTNGTFQFESAGMQKYLRDLKPDSFEDLIAMNALYRPGPLEYIPNYIARKHGTEKITYDLPEMEEYLKDTYGICVYQEQVMLLSQKMAGFSKGDADVLRKAMGKKQIAVLNKMKVQFLEGCAARNLDTAKCEKVWTDWEAFASYAFNKSHSTCYAFVAYQTAYLKAHYPAEYMAAVLTHNQNNIDKVTFFMDESRRMGIPVKGPDVNESGIKFSVNKKGEIRYGLGAIKGVGEAAVEEMISTRKKGGSFKNLFDLVKRVSLRTVNKKVMENLAYAGAFDGFSSLHRAQYFHTSSGEEANLLEKALRFGGQYQNSSAMASVSLFGGMMDTVKEPDIPKCPEWSLVQKLKHERDTIGVYLTGHPLDDYKAEIQGFCDCRLADIERQKGKDISLGCMVTAVNHRTGKNGNQFGNFTLEDFDGTHEISLFGNDYVNYKNFLEEGQFLFIKGRYIANYRGTEFELKINHISLLSSLRDRVRRITLHIPLSSINNQLIDKLDMMCKKYKGNTTLCLIITDTANKYRISMRSKTYKLAPSGDLYKTLEALGIEFRVG